MHTHCIYCQAVVVQSMNREGPNFCTNCQKLFYVPEDPKLPTWILGVLVVLVGNLQIVSC